MTETTKYADVILPASAFLEKAGTFTNAERRFQLVAAGDRPARRGEDRPGDHHAPSRARSATRWAAAAPADVMDEIAALTPSTPASAIERIGRTRPAVAGRRRRHRLADPLRASVLACPGGTRPVRRAALQAARRRRRRGVPADPRHRAAPAALQRRHDDAPDRQPRAARPRLAGDPPRRRRAAVDRPTANWYRSAAVSGGSSSTARVTDRIEPGHVFTALPLPGGPDEPADRVPPPTSTRAAPSTRSSPSTCGRCPSSRRHTTPALAAARERAGGRAHRADASRHASRDDGRRDEVAVEEPLEIRVDGAPLAVTMRTPGHDEELALGFLYGEGLIDGAAGGGADRGLRRQHRRGRRAAAARSRRPTLLHDLLVRRVREGGAGGGRGDRAGRRSADRGSPARLLADAARPPAPAELRAHRRTARHRDSSAPRASCCSCARTWAATTRWTRWSGARCSTASCRSAMASSASAGGSRFELVQKAAMAGAPILVGVGAPTSLAIELAADRGMTLAGFARRGSVNVYTGEQRLRDA